MQTPLASVVLLEDEPDDALFVRRALAKARIINPIIAFANAEQARRYFDESRRVPLPALFILDVKLGGSETGVAFLRWLRGPSGQAVLASFGFSAP